MPTTDPLNPAEHPMIFQQLWLERGLHTADLMGHKDFGTSADANECALFPKAPWDGVLDQLAATA